MSPDPRLEPVDEPATIAPDVPGSGSPARASAADAPAPDATGTGVLARLRRLARDRRSVVEWLVVAIVLGVLSFAVVSEHVAEQPMISPVDEAVYIDYVVKVPEQGVVRQGEELGDRTRQALTCRGVFWYIPADGDLCAIEDFSDGTLYPNDGVTTADAYTPLYPALTWAGMQVFELAGVSDWVTAMRLTGALWLLPGLLVLYAALRRLGFGALTAIAPPLVILGSLPILWSNTFVSTDAPTILAGSLMLLCTARLLTTGRGAWMFTVCAVLVTLLKFQNVAAVGAAILVLAWSEWRRSSGAEGTPLRWRTLLSRPIVVAILSSVVLVVFAQAAWLVLRAQLAVGPSPNQNVSEPLTVSRLLLESVGFFTEIGEGVGQTANLGEWALTLSFVMSLLVVVGTLGAALAPGLEEPFRTIATATTIMMFVLGPVLIAITVLVSGDFFRLPGRYALSLVPFALVGAAALMRTRWLSVTLCLVGVGMIAASLARVVIQ